MEKVKKDWPIGPENWSSQFNVCREMKIIRNKTLIKSFNRFFVNFQIKVLVYTKQRNYGHIDNLKITGPGC
jgi:hypothetical protein